MGKKSPRTYHQRRGKRPKMEEEEIKILDGIISERAPPRGSNLLAMSPSPDRQTFATARKFEDLPLSEATKSALKQHKFITLTAIQRASLPHALCGRDVLGAAKTGSGKTLAFLIPLIEKLYRLKWGKYDGLGALIISPTRELALQIFEELKKVGRNHEMSAGLLIGGKDVSEEASRVAGLNILVSTPGRLLQHMDETPGFDATSLQVLVLDEADRILDMGFSATLNAIVANLPRERQTMLFSATQTKSVSALARLSLRDPEYVAAHSEAETPTPVRLDQAYIECPLPDKFDILWSFIKTHLRSRIIVFFSTCKQVRFVYEAFRRLRPGTPLRALHGHMSQFKRMGVYEQFSNSKAGVLFATDVAARGLDFPFIDWVVQADCPEDVASYIHRVGRTARYTSAGHSLLLLLPSEKEGMVSALEEAKIPIKGLKHNPAKLQPITPALQALLSKDSELKEIAQRSLVSYLRATFLQPKKAIFDVSKLPVAEFALSIGLPTVPKLRFLKINTTRYSNDHTEKEESDEDSETKEEGEEEIERSSTDCDDLLVIKKRHNPDSGDEREDVGEDGDENAMGAVLVNNNLNKKKKKKMKIDPRKSSGTHVVFDDEGQAVDPLSLLGATNDEPQEADGVYTSVAERAVAAQALMARRDQVDKLKLKELRKEKKDAKRARRLERERQNAMDGVAILGGGDDIDLLESSDDEGPNFEEQKRRGNEAEVAHMGMISLENNTKNKRKDNKEKKEVVEMSLAEQEALALRLLRGGK